MPEPQPPESDTAGAAGQNPSVVIRRAVNVWTGIGSAVVATTGVLRLYGHANFKWALGLLTLMTVASSIVGGLWKKSETNPGWLILLSGLVFLPLSSGLVAVTGGLNSPLWLLFVLGMLSTVAVRQQAKAIRLNLLFTCVFMVLSMWGTTALERGVLWDDAWTVLIRVVATVTAWGVASTSLSAMWRASDDRERLERERLDVELEVQRRLTASLQEKETLLKEVHHRVKNNLQVISSLLNMQMGNSEHGEVRTLLLESTSRVRSMALIHELLYSSFSQSKVDFVEYTRRLTSYLRTSFRPQARIDVEGESAFLAVDVAVPCGLILNELVTNALKYGVRPGETGQVRVRIESTPDQFCMTVADGGAGLPESLQIESTTTLGMQLIQGLAKQLRAEFKAHGQLRNEFVLVFSTTPSAEDVGEKK